MLMELYYQYAYKLHEQIPYKKFSTILVSPNIITSDDVLISLAMDDYYLNNIIYYKSRW